MKVSIIIPVYNVEKYIERCINSVIRQTYTNIECIIVDDCCTDNSIRICEYIINNYNGPISFLILRHQQSEGPSGARNTGTDAATGKYIFYLDSDDEITDDCISLLQGAVIKYPLVEIVQGCTISEKNTDYYSLNRYDKIEYINNNNWIRQEFFNINKSFPVDVWNKLIQKEFITKYNIRFKDGIIHEDQLWSYNVMTKLQRLCFVHTNTYIHYSVPMSIMTSLTKKRSYNSWGLILEEIVSKMSPPFLDLQIRKYLLEYLYKIDYYNQHNIHSNIIEGFIIKSKKINNFKLYFALLFFKHSHKHKLGASIKQWLLTYCNYNTTHNLSKELIYDGIAIFAKIIKKRQIDLL